jgi:signal recognition particle subunit SRP19
MSHARIEEVSDSDPSEGIISDVDEDFDERDILRARPGQAQPASSFLSSSLSRNNAVHPAAIPASKLNPPPFAPPRGNPSMINPSAIPSAAGSTQFQHTEDDSKYKDFQCIYPVYFDKSRSRGEGRMVGKELAVENPLAREIVNACGRLRLETLFEPAKCHPKDWANPGRVKVKLKGGQNSTIKNSEQIPCCHDGIWEEDLVLTSNA